MKLRALALCTVVGLILWAGIAWWIHRIVGWLP